MTIFFKNDAICDSAPLNEALWGEYQNWEKHFIAIKLIFCTFWCKNDNSAIFLSKLMKCWTSPCMMSFKTTLQRLGLSKMVICVYFYGPIKKKILHNTSYDIFTEKHVCHNYVWYDEDLEWIYQKWKILTLVHIFSYN